MSWICKLCGCVNRTELSTTCSGCYASRHGRLVLTGTSGTLSFGVTSKVGTRNAKVFAGDDFRYFAKHQFSLVRQDEIWLLVALNSDANVPNLTMINGSPCGDAPVTLNEGDIICISSRADHFRSSSTFTVSFS